MLLMLEALIIITHCHAITKTSVRENAIKTGILKHFPFEIMVKMEVNFVEKM